MPASIWAAAGEVSLWLAGVCAAISMVAHWRRAPGAERGDAERRALGWDRAWIWAAFYATTGAVGLLSAALWAGRFEFAYVAAHTARDLAPGFRLTALWSGQAGSLVFWLWLSLGYASWLAWRGDRLPPGLVRRALAVLSGMAAFFAALTAGVADPFRLQLPAPADGRGLNPLLQSYWMAMHPVFLYLGYIGFSVPFSLAIAALWSKRLDAAWIRAARPYMIVAWAFLSAGILLGARWAYEELGWGGYWAWDPVENASFMPWLAATAFIHSVIIEEKRGMLRRWNVGLIGLTYALTVFGTFLTRSGILDSVHAFAVSPIGPWFILYLGLVGSLFSYLFIDRAPLLSDTRRPESPLSKEGGFLFNNLLLVGAAFAVLWGTVFPLIGEWIGRPVTVAAPYFNRVTGPIFLALLVLMGIGPVLAWRRSRLHTLARHLGWPALAGTVAAAWLALLGVRKPAIVGVGGAAVFVATGVLVELVKAALVRMESRGERLALSLWRVVNRNPRRYGGYAVHLGIVCLALGIAVSSAYQHEAAGGLRPGQTLAVGPYRLMLDGMRQTIDGGVPAVAADVAVMRGGAFVTVLSPTKRFYPRWVSEMGPTTEVAIHTTALSDLYVVLAGWSEDDGVVGLKAYFNPLVGLIWVGGALLIAGTAFALWPRPVRAGARADAYLHTLAELEYDFRMEKLAPDEFRALQQELAAPAAASLAEEAAAIARVRRELAGEQGGR